jgi:hypothetical protein
VFAAQPSDLALSSLDPLLHPDPTHGVGLYTFLRVSATPKSWDRAQQLPNTTITDVQPEHVGGF